MERILDVCLDFDPLRLAREVDPTRMIAETSRLVAEEKCAAAGATLRHPDPREVHASSGIDPLTGDEVLLVSTRWVVDAPAA